MIRLLALILVFTGLAHLAEARQPLFLLTVTSPTTDSAAYSVDIVPLARICRPFEASSYGCFYAVDACQQLTLTATLAPGYSVAQWTGLCAPAGTAVTAIVTVPAADSISGCGLTLAYDAKAAISGWWWVPDEPGRGYSLALNDEGRVFIAAYGFAEDGSSLWRSGTLNRSDAGSSLTIYRGIVAEHRGGGTLTGGEAGNAVRTGRHWTASLAISSRGGADSLLSLTDNVDGTAISKRIRRFPIDGAVVRAAPAGAAAGWYYDPTQPGVGYFVEQQGDRAFASAFAYGADGAPVWYVMGASVAPTGGGWLMEADVTAYRGGSPFSAATPGAVPVPVPAGSVSAALAPAGVVLRLSNGRRITLSPFAW